MGRPRWTILTDTMNGYESLMINERDEPVTFRTRREAESELDNYAELMCDAWGVGLDRDSRAEFIVTNGRSRYLNIIRIGNR